MRIPGADQAIGKLMKWATKEEWVPCREQVFSGHLEFIEERYQMTGETLVELLGGAFNMIYAVILEDFFSARFGDDELNIIDDYLKRRGWREKVAAKRYLEEIRDSIISLYEVVDLNPGKTMAVRDLILGGEPITVTEKLGSETATRWDRIAARVVTVGGTTYFTGALLLVSHKVANKLLADLDELVKTFRTKLKKEAKKTGENPDLDPQQIKAMMLASVGPQMVTQAWLVDALDQIHAPLPEMRNSDGDEILFSEVRFPISGDVNQVSTIIDGLEHIERNDPDSLSWSWHGVGSPSQRMSAKKHQVLTLQTTDDAGRTSLGNIEIKNGALLLSTNSRERAQKGRDLLASHLGKLIGPALISHEDIEQAMAKSRGRPASDKDEIPPEIAAQVIQKYMDDHYRKTLDDPVPALDGKTPRQSVKTWALTGTDPLLLNGMDPVSAHAGWRWDSADGGRAKATAGLFPAECCGSCG